MSDVKPHMNANTSVLEYLVDNTQHLMGRFRVWMCHFEQRIFSKCHKMASY